MRDRMQVLKQPFNVNIHAETFTYYCEVIIFPDGTIEYAVPSHEQKLVEIYARIHNIDKDEAMDILQRQHDPTDFAMHDTGCMYVWYDHLYNGCNLTKEQHYALRMLLAAGCISDDCLDDIVTYSPYKSAFELRNAQKIARK